MIGDPVHEEFIVLKPFQAERLYKPGETFVNTDPMFVHEMPYPGAKAMPLSTWMTMTGHLHPKHESTAQRVAEVQAYHASQMGLAAKARVSIDQWRKMSAKIPVESRPLFAEHAAQAHAAREAAHPEFNHGRIKSLTRVEDEDGVKA